MILTRDLLIGVWYATFSISTARTLPSSLGNTFLTISSLSNGGPGCNYEESEWVHMTELSLVLFSCVSRHYCYRLARQDSQCAEE